MFDSPLERSLTYRLGSVYDCWGHRRTIRHASHNGLWFLDAADLDHPHTEDIAVDPTPARQAMLARFVESGLFTDVEIRTLHALVVLRLTIAEIAIRDGCSRQAVLARLNGNSRGQGGIIKKAYAFHGAVGQ